MALWEGLPDLGWLFVPKKRGREKRGKKKVDAGGFLVKIEAFRIQRNCFFL